MTTVVAPSEATLNARSGSEQNLEASTTAVAVVGQQPGECPGMAQVILDHKKVHQQDGRPATLKSF